MFIKQVKSFDKFSDEADIVVTDGKFELMCYCHPSIQYPIGTEVKDITSFLAKNIMRAECNDCLILKLEDYYAYHLQGKIIDLINKVVLIGGIQIILDMSIPNDIKLGEYIEFDVLRLNCEIQ